MKLQTFMSIHLNAALLFGKKKVNVSLKVNKFSEDMNIVFWHFEDLVSYF